MGLGRGMTRVVRLGAARIGAGASWGPGGALGAPACNWAGRRLGSELESSGCARFRGVIEKGYVNRVKSRMIHGTSSVRESGGIMSPPSSTGPEPRPVTALFFPGEGLRLCKETPRAPRS